MESSKNFSFSSLFKTIQEKFKPFTENGMQLIERSSQNIFIFSKLTIDKSEFLEIYEYVNIIKEQTLKESLGYLKSAIQYVVIFTNTPQPLTTKDQIYMLFSACFLHYYSTFAYETLNSFEDFYTESFIQICKGYNIEIIDSDKFQIFAKKFYIILKNVIQSQIDYSQIKKLYDYYNPHIIQEQKSPSAFVQKNQFSTKSKDPTELLKEHLNHKTNSCNLTPFSSTLLTYLTTATERLVYLVLETHQINKFHTKDPEKIKTFLERVSTQESQNFQSFLNEKSNYNQLTESKDNQMINDDSSTLSNTSSENKVVYSKLVFGQLSKCEVSETIKSEIDSISQRVDECFLDVLINQNQNCNISIVGSFICYLVEITEKMIKLIPEFSHLKEKMTLRFMVSAKNIYNKVLEIYFSLSDLKLTDGNTFLLVIRKRGLPMKYASCLYWFFTGFADEFKKESNDFSNKIDLIFDRFLESRSDAWKTMIQERAQTLTQFSKIYDI